MQKCNLASRDAYSNFVVGTVSAVATDKQAIGIFNWAKKNGYWNIISDKEERFIQLIQVVSVSIPEAGEEVELSLLMAKAEYDASPILPGDLVRYTRHRSDEPMMPLFRAPEAKKYWELFGCIAVLCREDDSHCHNQYVQGIFRFEDGIKLDRLTNQPVLPEQRINIETFLPVATSKRDIEAKS